MSKPKHTSGAYLIYGCRSELPYLRLVLGMFFGEAGFEETFHEFIGIAQDL
jgi:hypothetical protein